MADPTPVVGSVRSLRFADLTLAPVKVLPPLDPRIVPPPALRLPLDVATPAIVRVPLLECRPAVSSYPFAPAAAPTSVQPERAPPPVPGPEVSQQEPGPPAPRRTRITLPRDVVKLSERFFFLLQPDLETMLHAGSLEFPRQPFPFQLEGMAFLVPRHGAVLADEMGLGKSRSEEHTSELQSRL